MILTRNRLSTFFLALAGALTFAAIGLPLPFLFGPLVFCLIAALSGAQLENMGILGTYMRTILGVAIGASIQPDVVERLPQMAASVALIPIYIGVIGLIGVPFFTRVCGFDRATAWYASMPGGLQDMVLFGQEAGGDVRALSLIHATRVLVIIILAPIIMVAFFDAEFLQPIGAPATSMPSAELAIMAAAGLIGWQVGERLRLFGASILGPLILTAILSLTGVIENRPPAEAILAAQLFIGLTIGVYYTGITLQEVRKDVLAGVAFMVLLAALAAAFTEVVYLLGLAPPIDAFLAFAPGGQAEMVILAILAGADLGYVVVHHLVRVMVVILFAPLAARLAGITRGKPPPS